MAVRGLVHTGAGSFPVSTLRVYDTYTSRRLGHLGWNARPRSPPSPLGFTVMVAKSRTCALLVAVTGTARILAWLAVPAGPDFSATYHVLSSPGAWVM